MTTPPKPAAPKQPSVSRCVQILNEAVLRLTEECDHELAADLRCYVITRLERTEAERGRLLNENEMLLGRIDNLTANINALASEHAAERDRLRGLLERIPAQVRRVARATPPGERKRMANHVAADIEAALAADAAWQPTHRHVKSGKEYRFEEVGKLEATWTDAAMYRNADGLLISRDLAEFNDGRFEKIAADAVAQGDGGGDG